MTFRDPQNDPYERDSDQEIDPKFDIPSGVQDQLIAETIDELLPRARKLQKRYKDEPEIAEELWNQLVLRTYELKVDQWHLGRQYQRRQQLGIPSDFDSNDAFNDNSDIESDYIPVDPSGLPEDRLLGNDVVFEEDELDLDMESVRSILTGYVSVDSSYLDERFLDDNKDVSSGYQSIESSYLDERYLDESSVPSSGYQSIESGYLDERHLDEALDEELELAVNIPLPNEPNIPPLNVELIEIVDEGIDGIDEELELDNLEEAFQTSDRRKKIVKERLNRRARQTAFQKKVQENRQQRKEKNVNHKRNRGVGNVQSYMDDELFSEKKRQTIKRKSNEEINL